MNEPILHLNKRDHENIKVMLRLKKNILPILTRCTFLFDDSILGELFSVSLFIICLCSVLSSE